MRRSPFHQYHSGYDAKFIDVVGWEMPESYGSSPDEHRHVRSAAGLFDLSHLARFKVAGRGATDLLENVLTRRVSDMPDHTCRYSLICNEAGGVLDEVTVYRFSDHWALVGDAANRDRTAAHLRAAAGDTPVRVDDQTEVTAMIALQGPEAVGLVGRFIDGVTALKRSSFCIRDLLVLHVVISRGGYTGEDGVEIILPARTAALALQVLASESHQVEGSIRPCGLGARETLRLEAGLPRYGHELDEQTDPLSAGLAFAVDLDTHRDADFFGQDALRRIAERGPRRKRVGLRLDGEQAPGRGMAVCAGAQQVGRVTSGCVSPTLGYPIAMACVDAESASVDNAVTVELDPTPVAARVVALPFYQRS